LWLAYQRRVDAALFVQAAISQLCYVILNATTHAPWRGGE
jgi:hypothetical protein